MSSTFVQMYHPLLPATADNPVRVAFKSVDEHEAKGWLQVDPDAPSPPASTPFFSREAADSRFVQDAQLPAKMATVASGDNAFTLAQRAASVAAVVDDLSDDESEVSVAVEAASQGAARSMVAAEIGDTGTPVGAAAAAVFPALASPFSREALETQNAAALRPWHTSVAGRDSARAVWYAWGHSFTEGIGAGTLENRWLAHAQRLYRARYPLAVAAPGGAGYFPTWLGNAVPTGPWVITGSPEIKADFGLGRRNIKMTAACTATLTFTGTDVVLFHGKGDNAAGSFTWAIDGGAATTVSWGAGPFGGQPAVGGQTIPITGLTAGQHTLTVTWVSGNVPISGAWVFNGDYAKGIHVLDGGHAGFAVSDFTNAQFWLADIVAVQPSLITIELGVNDQRIKNISPAQFKTNLATLLTQVRAKLTAPCSIALIADYQATGTFTHPWSGYVAALRELVAADPTLALIDLGKRMEPAVVANANGLYLPDLIHPSAKGHPFIGQIVAKALEPR